MAETALLGKWGIVSDSVRQRRRRGWIWSDDREGHHRPPNTCAPALPATDPPVGQMGRGVGSRRLKAVHPYTQQQVMLELQRIALRQRLQIVVASHSPVVLDCVPPEGRKFLDRDDATNDVRLMPAYRDIFQKSLYGQSRETLSILCEDEVAEGIILGVLDVLQPKLVP